MPLMNTFAGNALEAYGFTRGASADDFELIATATGTGSSGIITFSSIPSTYKHLQIRAVARTNDAGVQQHSYLTFNGDSGTNYSWNSMQGGTNLDSSGNVSQTFMRAGLVIGSGSTADSFTAAIYDVLDYANTNKNKTFRSIYTFGSDFRVGLFAGAWRSTSAVSSVTFTMNAGSFVTPTRYSLYGIRG